MKFRQVFIFKGITRRWVFNSMGIIVAILGIVWVVFAFAVHNYYYSAVQSYLTTEARVRATQFTRDIDPQTPDFYATAKDFVASFSDRGIMELLILNKKGDVLLTSSDFLPDQKLSMPDFTQASASAQGLGNWMGVNASTGEKVMAVTSILRDSQGKELGAARYVVSMTEVDWQIALFSLISGIICIAIILFVLFSGMYFINSIVVPVREVTAMAGRIASGDYNARIGKSYDDEIGALCDTINNLAGELGTADRIKNDFISSVSHELRTPLTAIKGWAETIQGCAPGDTDTIHKGMRVITDETGRLSAMVEDLLDFSRMQSGRFRMAIDKIDILAEMGEAVLMFSDRAHREGLTFIYNEPASLPPMMGDRNRLRQVFVNILDNAFKYSDAGGVVKVDAIDCGNHVRIIVSDTGCGIPARDLSRVKQKFFKGNATRRGSGIGLAVADEIVCLHGGTLEIASEEGKGTAVTITLPVISK
ncbi:sensor histidine kinase [Ethanoligenens harbinense]|uniref:histidine kinase n=1 Tax=Ethanoligenens harbinense (strain DSM 18485 / JCM 12961 / CGMCC 1.5033 / YUAN-3) TaxID=663278 RepID=E6U332_ETHHY|nr:HAMP domain-containing sensor histidine kinase [Ethanoligenens harbinense]ADU27504.1 integral membrane sensor signal transduction histidine kinase [Ethanoligenens harbinense YUAN-3]AVQ96559.1 sensor histidine kinase [Ethanoligenens harbinense YUAN-3]AYF39220.1 sensor histidine kinase [Ethanoligenens harbinense]AYF42044.1 sensor histidine kinase [Ethanoligenens harbinense]QCN92799.1 sensor histidine kinase [Ethanoligenens harbinense]